MNISQELWWARGIKVVIEADFEKLKKILGLTDRLTLEIRYIETGGFYFGNMEHIKLGVRTGYHRKLLVHECLHAAGLEHNGTDFSSSLTYDKISPQIERLVFG